MSAKDACVVGVYAVSGTVVTVVWGGCLVVAVLIVDAWLNK